ncbi:MAG TPA: hypothetical protein DEQ34_12415 [Balneolaceae bacterium]|nr:hypothetical protein [Balneolaceae bacterium]|tara:strand:- start:233322 stop:234725 length:1404 start_codon:yes stop_codon:yes gene_type:complete
MATISSLMSQTSSYETFVSQLVEIESQKKYQLQVSLSDRKEERTALGAVSKAISAFESKIEELASPTNNALEPFTTTSSNESAVKINSASGLDRPAEYKIDVTRTASYDTKLSQVMTGADSDLAAFSDGEVTITVGDQTETISIATTKDDGSGGTIDMTNEEIMQAFADEVNSLFDGEVSASLFNTNDSEIQLSLRSLTTGYDNRIQISGATGALAEITDNVSSLTAESELNALFTVDGVTFERSENTVTDAIDGLSFTLLKETTEQESMTVERDITTAKGNITDFINSFNEVNETIRERTFINPDTGNKGPLQGMRSIRNLSLSLRQTALLAREGTVDGDLGKLSDIGITFENDGTMKIEDSDLLEEALNDRPDEVYALFSDETSPIQLMKAQAESYTEADGILAALEEGVDLSIDRLDKRIEKEEKYLSEYEEKQRLIFNQLDLLLEEGQAQFDQVVNSLYSYSY